jgi:type 1 glutamine amidotransferase
MMKSLLSVALVVAMTAGAQQPATSAPAKAQPKVKKEFAPQPIPAADRAKIAELIDGLKLAKPATPKKILVFWRCEGFAHGKSIEYGNAMYEIASEKGYFKADLSNNYADLSAENLAKYDILVLNNTTGLKYKEHDLEKVLAEFVRGGKGYVVLHGGADNFKGSDTLCAITGTLFAGHPWGSNGSWQFKVDDPNSPLTAPFGKAPFKMSDEIYQGEKQFCDRSKMNVLVSLDFSDPTTANSNVKSQNNKETNDYPVSWTRTEGKGRVFYTSFAHDQRAYLEPQRLAHILLASQWAAGEIK